MDNNTEETERIRITAAEVSLTTTEQDGAIFRGRLKYLRGAILETVMRDFLNDVRKNKRFNEGLLRAGGVYGINVVILETINIDTLEREVRGAEDE